jgi:transposase
VSGLDLTLEPERRLRRIEVINGAGGRRRWSADDKARIVEETLVPGAVVSEVARRHDLSPQQLFGWRREARRALRPAGGAAEPASFVPAVVEEAPPMSAPRPAARRRERGLERSADAIELEIGGVVVRVGPDASPKAIAAVIRALKAAA